MRNAADLPVTAFDCACTLSACPIVDAIGMLYVDELYVKHLMQQVFLSQPVVMTAQLYTWPGAEAQAVAHLIHLYVILT